VKSSVLLIVILLFAAAVPAFADKTGNDVLDSCQTGVRLFDNGGAPTGEHFDGGWCFGG